MARQFTLDLLFGWITLKSYLFYQLTAYFYVSLKQHLILT